MMIEQFFFPFCLVIMKFLGSASKHRPAVYFRNSFMHGCLFYLSGVPAQVCNSEIELSLPGGTLGYLYINGQKKTGFELNVVASFSSRSRQEVVTHVVVTQLSKCF